MKQLPYGSLGVTPHQIILVPVVNKQSRPRDSRRDFMESDGKIIINLQALPTELNKL